MKKEVNQSPEKEHPFMDEVETTVHDGKAIGKMYKKALESAH